MTLAATAATAVAVTAEAQLWAASPLWLSRHRGIQ